MAKIEFKLDRDFSDLGIDMKALKAAKISALQELAIIGKQAGQAHIRSVPGFGSGSWWKAFSAKVYKDTPALQWYHPIPFSNVFEESTYIKGPLWVPTIERVVAKRMFTPSRFRQEIGPLRQLDGKGGTKVLMANALVPRSFAYPNLPPKNLTLGQFAAAASSRGRRGGGSLIKRAVTVFIGIPGYQSRKRFNLRNVLRGVVAQAEDIFLKKLGLE